MSVIIESQTGSEFLPLNLAYPFANANGLSGDISIIRNMAIDGIKNKSGVRRACIAHLFQEKGLLEKFIDQAWPYARSERGIKKLQWYERLRARHIDRLQGGECLSDEYSSTDDNENENYNEQAFALEADLRDFLANNLSIIEPNLRLYKSENKGGIEFQLTQGRIDILAVDRENKFVVIELKLSRGRERTIGQLLYYMGWVDENLGSAPCRGVIVASDITTELATAVRRVPGVTLFKYRISLSVERVNPSAA